MTDELPHYAGFWRRKTAYAIDLVIVAVLCMLFEPLLGASHAMSVDEVLKLQQWGLFQGVDPAMLLNAMDLPSFHDIRNALLLGVAVSAVYNIGFLATPWHATPGKYWCGMKVVMRNGERVGIIDSAARHLMTGVTMGVLSGLGYLTMAFGHEKAALHDLICGTRVILKKGAK